MKKNIVYILALLCLNTSVSILANSQERLSHPDAHHDKDIQALEVALAHNHIHHIHVGKKLTGPLMAVLDVAVQFQPEILDSMQKATGRADATFKMLGGEAVNPNISSEEILQYFEKTQIKGTFDGEFKGMGLPLAVYFYNKQKHVKDIVGSIRESFVTEDMIQNSVLIKFFTVQAKQKNSPVAPVSLKNFQDNFVTFLKREILTGSQLQAFVAEVKQFYGSALTPEEKKAYLSGILMFVAQFFDEMKKNSHKVVSVFRESLFGDQKTDIHDEQSYMLKYFKDVSAGKSDQTLLAYLDQEIKTAEQLTAVCGEIRTFFADVYASMTPVAIDAFHKYHAKKHKVDHKVDHKKDAHNKG